MNRSFRAQDSLMPSIRSRVPQLRSLKEPTMKEKEDDLALFLEMRKREKEKNDLLLQNSEELDDQAMQPGISPLFSIPPAAPVRKTVTDDFLNSENDKNDYDWLLTPPGTPLFPSLDVESRKAYGETEPPNTRSTTLKSRLANSQPEATNTIRSGLASRQPTTSPGLSSSSSALRRPSSSGGMSSRPVTPSASSGSRPATPTGRPSLTTSSSRASRSSTPTSRPTLSSTKPALTSSTRPTPSLASNRSTSSMSSHKPTPVPRSSIPSRSSTPSRPTARSSTPTTSRSTARSSTPTTRPTSTVSTVSRSSSRPSTPTRRPSTPSRSASTPASSLIKSTSQVNKTGPTGAPSRNLGPSRPASPSVRPKPWKPSEMPGFSHDAPPNLRTTLPDCPLSASRGRPGGPTARSASVEPATTPGRNRRQSCSPSRGRAPSGSSRMSGTSVPAVNRLYSRANEEVSPVVMGNKMVERVVNMRKLAPPRQDDKHSPSFSGKSASSPDSTGFGRTLSKKSLDMAIRHMDIRRTIPGNLRPLMTNIPASSMYSVRSGPARSRTVSVSDSPLATSSNASSELSVNNSNAVRILDVHETEGHGFSR